MCCSSSVANSICSVGAGGRDEAGANKQVSGASRGSLREGYKVELNVGKFPDLVGGGVVVNINMFDIYYYYY